MENIFEGAKFGNKFLTRDGRIAIYINNDSMRFHYLGIEPCTVSGIKIDTIRYLSSGKVDTGYRDSLDIISRYKEPLKEVQQRNPTSLPGVGSSLEDFVTLEQAQAIKELGFPQEYDDFMGTRIHYNKEGVLCYHSNVEIYDNILCACPTLSLVQKWLRKKAGLYIIVHCPFKKNHWEYDIDTFYNRNEIQTISNRYGFTTYEQALSAGIDKCIELLKRSNKFVLHPLQDVGSSQITWST